MSENRSLIPASPRLRRRLGYAVALLLAAGIVAVVIVLAPSRAPRRERVSATPAAAEPVSRAKTATPERVRLARKDRLAIAATLARFIPAAVERRDPLAAWELVTPSLRLGQTRAEWRRGNLPVFPFQTRARRFDGWRIKQVRRNQVAFDLLLPPARGAGTEAVSYSFVFKRRDGRWLVDAAVPVATIAAGSGPPKVVGQADLGPTPGTNDRSGRLSAAWFAVPFGLLGGLIIVVPVTLGLLSWRRGRRAQAAYRRSLAA